MKSKVKKETAAAKASVNKKPKVNTKQMKAKDAGKKQAGRKSAKTKNAGIKKKKRRTSLFSIRNKIIVCFLVPIVFMIVLGVMSYKQTATGMSEAYRDSTQQTIKMASEYIDVVNNFIRAELLKYARNGDVQKYFSGIYVNDATQNMALLKSASDSISSSQRANSFISDVHLISTDDVRLISTRTTAKAGIYDKYMAEMLAVSDDGKTVNRWIDHHDELDAYLGIDASDYILACQMELEGGKGVAVLDVKASEIRKLLSEIDLGEGSIVGLVTAGGREVSVGHDAEGQLVSYSADQVIFADKDFFAQMEESSGVMDVRYEGAEYLYLYCTSEMTGASVCGLIPMSLVTAQADSIRQMTLVGVILSSIIVCIIGIGIAGGIRKNMRRISGSLEVVAEGNLATKVSVKGRDEFRGLAAAANNMIANNKQLVQQVSSATDKLEKSAKEVTEVSGVIQEYSKDISRAIDDINEGMVQQSTHAQECVSRTDTLSSEIQEVSRVARDVEALVSNAEKMIQSGMQIVELLGQRAQETTEVTARVGESIAELKQGFEIIDRFVSTITDISEQTNLLSLNASIEAARAGEAGRGFAVVAEEIRKLADNSAEAAGEIRNNVELISSQTSHSVESAKQAGEMVALQTASVQEVIGVFQSMNKSMEELFDGLKQILISTERADKERMDTLEAVRNISQIIEKTAMSAEVVQNIAISLTKNVENLNGTAENLDDNMNGLKTEISVFKTE